MCLFIQAGTAHSFVVICYALIISSAVVIDLPIFFRASLELWYDYPDVGAVTLKGMGQNYCYHNQQPTTNKNKL